MSRLSTNYDRIITSAPLDRQAAIIGAADGQGEDIDVGAPTLVGDRRQWAVPPSCSPKPPTVQSIVGMTVGRLTVISYFGSHPKQGSRWLVRCSCSMYELRRTKSITEPKGEDEQACALCERAAHAQRLFKAAQTGRWPDGRASGLTGLNTSTGVRRLKDAVAP